MKGKNIDAGNLNLVVARREEDSDIVHDILKQCREDLLKKGQTYWSKTPDREELMKNINEESVLILYGGNNAVGTFTLIKKPIPSAPKAWLEDGKGIYLKGLAVIPEKQGGGLGEMLCQAAEHMARGRGFESLRFWTVNALDEFYLKQDYKIAPSDKIMWKGYEIRFFEKRLR